MREKGFLFGLAFLGLVSQAQALEGNWPFSVINGRLRNHGYVRTVTNCRETNSYVAQHCTIDYQNSDGVRISIAVRNTFDSRPDRVYRIVCTASCEFLE